jgi:hypothetical protein
MNIRKLFSDSNTLMRIGVTSLIVELFSQLYLHPNSLISGNAIDGMKGFLIGVSIACNLLAISVSKRHGPGHLTN